jgi:hypothetical protein
MSTLPASVRSELPLSVADRIAFWQRLHERLAGLSNRVDPTKILSAIHDKVPMVTQQEQQQLKLENARADEQFWSWLHDSHEATAADHKQLVSEAEAKIAENHNAAAAADAKAAEARARVERLQSGEDLPGGLGKPFDAERCLREVGWTTRDLNDARLLSKVCDALGDDFVIKHTADAGVKARKREQRAALRRLARRLEVISHLTADEVERLIAAAEHGVPRE